MMYSIIVLGDINEDGYGYDAKGEMIKLEIGEISEISEMIEDGYDYYATGEMIELEIDEDDEDSFE